MSSARTLNRDEVMKVWRLCENFVERSLNLLSTKSELVFDAFSDSELMERA